MPESLFTWEAIATLAGAAFLTFLIVAYTKNPIDRYWPKILGTDLYAVLVGFVILSLAALATGQPVTWAMFVLALFNGFLVAATAGKVNDKVLTEEKKKKGGLA